MLFKKYVNSASNLFVANRVLKFVIVVLVMIVAYSIYTISKIEDNKTTILLPLGLTEQVEVSGSYADISYLSAMGVYVATLKYSTTPRTVLSQYKMLLTLLSPEAYTEYSERLLTTADNQIKNEVTFQFRIENLSIETEPEPSILVKLIYNKYLFRDLVESEKTVEMKIYYSIRYGKFTIYKITEEQK